MTSVEAEAMVRPRGAARNTELRRRFAAADPLLVLRVYLVVLVFSPPVYIIGPLGAAGTPAGVLGILMLGLWTIDRISRKAVRPRPTVLHWALLAFVISTLVSFAVAMTRPASESEVLGAERGLLVVASWSGVILVAAYCVQVRQRFEALLRFVVRMGACLGAMAILQFFTRIDYIGILHLPGLVLNTDVATLYVRAGYARVSATAIHSIELSMVLGVIVPLAFYKIRSSPRRPVISWLELFLILGAFPLTVSRSGVIALALGMGAGLLILRPRQRVALVAMSTAVGGLMAMAVPGLLNAVMSLFTLASQDTSVTAREADYTVVADYFSQRPWLGRGLYTFIPSMFRTLDNQYLGTLIELGMVGLVSLVVLIVLPALRCIVTRSGGEWPLRIAGASSIAVGAALFATFDAMSFPMAMGMFVLILGMSRVTWPRRVPTVPWVVSGVPGREDSPPRVPRLTHVPLTARVLGVAVATGAAAVVAVGGLAVLSRAHDAYQAIGSFVVRVPSSSVANVYNSRADTYGVSDVLWAAMAGEDEHDRLRANGVPEFSMAIGTGSLEPGTDRLGYGDTMYYRAVASDPERAASAAREVLLASSTRLLQLQTDEDSVTPKPLVEVADASEPVVSRVSVHRSLAAIAVAALAGVAFRLVLMFVPIGQPRGQSRRFAKTVMWIRSRVYGRAPV